MLTELLLGLWGFLLWLCGLLMRNKDNLQSKKMSDNESSSCASCIPVAISTVDSRNIVQMMPVMEKAIKQAAFCALDVEFSGLGDRKLLGANIIDDRYEAMSAIADSRSILAIGLSCFKRKRHCNCQSTRKQDENEDADETCCHAVKLSSHTFNILLHSQDAYSIDPDAALFLCQHGFDFNQLFQHGIRFSKKGIHSKEEGASHDAHKLFQCILKSKIPIILHNGLLDLCFLYRNFYGTLPGKLPTFVADLTEMFIGGVYDTKYISMFYTPNYLTQLEYTFKKSLQENYQRYQTEKPCAYIVSKSKASWAPDTPVMCCPHPRHGEADKLQNLCKYFLKNGHCTNMSCEKLHSVDLILIREKLATPSKKSKKRKLDKSDNVEQIKLECTGQSEQQNSNCHQAGYDAFMTGYVFAVFLAQFGENTVFHEDSVYRNRLPLSRKDIPLHLVKSHFATTSTVHNRNSTDACK